MNSQPIPARHTITTARVNSQYGRNLRCLWTMKVRGLKLNMIKFKMMMRLIYWFNVCKWFLRKGDKGIVQLIRMVFGLIYSKENYTSYCRLIIVQ